MENFYEILRIKPNATPEEIKRAFISLASMYHPDRYVGDKKFAESYMASISEAYCTLRDPVKRMDYDIIHNINKTPSKFERKHSKPLKEKPKTESYAKKTNEKIYVRPISSKYFRNSKRKKSNLFAKIFKSKLFYSIMFVLLLEIVILFLIFGGVFD